MQRILLSIALPAALVLGSITLSGCNDTLCGDSCVFNNDGVCDDDDLVCDYGTDCSDCGERDRKRK